MVTSLKSGWSSCQTTMATASPGTAKAIKIARSRVQPGPSGGPSALRGGSKRMAEPNQILVVAAHPDDEVLGCGATVRRLVDAGWRAHLAILSAGIGGRHALPEANLPQVKSEQAALRQQMERAAEI